MQSVSRTSAARDSASTRCSSLGRIRPSSEYPSACARRLYEVVQYIIIDIVVVIIDVVIIDDHLR